MVAKPERRWDCRRGTSVTKYCQKSTKFSNTQRNASSTFFIVGQRDTNMNLSWTGLARFTKLCTTHI